MIGLVDTHAHLHDSKFDGKVLEVLRESRSQVKAIINLGTDLMTSQAAYQIYQDQEYQDLIDIYWGAGLHPHHADDQYQLDSLVDLILDKSDQLIAIGEAGLDYHYLYATKQNQIRAFVTQAELAVKIDKPLVIHARDAWDDLYGILKEIRPKGVIHSFTGDSREVERLTDLGCYFGISGIATFIKEQGFVDALRLIPGDRIVFETDCPYLSPVPMRGRLNIPGYLKYTLEFLAKLRSDDLEELAKTSRKNTNSLFGVRIE